MVGLDSSILIYHLEDDPRFGALAAEALRTVTPPQGLLVMSVTAVGETLALPFRLGREDVAQTYLNLIRSAPGLRLLDVTLAASVLASRLKGSDGLAWPDSLHIATCALGSATAFLTNDARLRRVRDIDVIVLSDFL